MSANLPPLPRGRRMGSGVINGKLIELFMHDDAAMLAYATAALSAQATEVEALRADAETRLLVLHNVEVTCPPRGRHRRNDEHDQG